MRLVGIRALDSLISKFPSLEFSRPQLLSLASTRSLNNLVRRVLKSNANMSNRLRNIERMHPALANSTIPSCASMSVNEHTGKRSMSPAFFDFAFEEDLQTSRVYRRAALDETRFSKALSSNSIGNSFLSGLSLSDVSDVSAISLPISPMELWNHHRYGTGRDTKLLLIHPRLRHGTIRRRW